MKEQNNNTEKTRNEESTFSRRSMLKALAGIPVLGFLGYQVLAKSNYHEKMKQEAPRILKALNLDDIEVSVPDITSPSVKGDLIRLGIIGYGTRGVQLAKSLGFMTPQEVEERKKNNTLERWYGQQNLKVAITGICEVYDMRAEEGLICAKNPTHAERENTKILPVKRYRHYHEMLASDDIDAVIISTPDHHHAQITMDAVKAGKHVYCEKCFTRTEEELYRAYDVVKNGNVVFQLGHQIPQNQVFKQAKEIIRRNILGEIGLIETTTNRNSASGAWIRHLDDDGNLKPGNEQNIDWEQWLGSRPKVPFSKDRYYNWTKWFDYARGLFSQLFTHEFDAVNQLLNLGIPSTAVASGGIYHWKDNREMPDVLHAVYEYPERDLSFVYSASLGSSRDRGRLIMGREGSMDLGWNVNLMIDRKSEKFKEEIEKGIITPGENILTVDSGFEEVDGVSSATASYYASRGLIDTTINGKLVDVTHLHLKEWLNCIRHGGEPSANIETAFQETVAVHMGHKAYMEKRKVKWDPEKNRIV